MKASSRNALLMLLFTLMSAISHAQHAHNIGVRSNVQQGVIRLRWATSSPMAWKQTLQHGVRIERYTVVRQGEMLQQPEKVVLTPAPIKAQPLDQWKDLALSNNYAAVIAQAIYGEDFNMSEQDQKGVSKFIALAQELEQRHLISMYAADLCYPAALLAGWGFEDKTAKPGERYLYRVISAVPEKTLKIEMGSVYVSLADEATFPQPQEVVSIFGDKTALLAWNYSMLSSVYIAYFLEKSEDGKTFKRLSDIPLANMNSKNGKPADRMFFTDSLSNNSTTTYYRVIGVTPFGQEGPPSEVVKGQGRIKLVHVPHIERAVPDKNDVLTVEWEFDQRGNEQIRAFELQRSNQAKGPYTAVVKNISVNARMITYDSLQATNYFVIAAIPKNGDAITSFPVLVQPSDTIPPSKPTGLTGTIDSLGVVRLNWKANTEKDIYGYRIYRAQTKGEELIPLNDVAVKINSFVDTLQVKSLNSQVFYAVTALDWRYNQSDKSPVAAIVKPEVVPPSQPLITSVKFTGRGVQLNWATGGEENLRDLKLYRRDRSEKENLLVKTFSDTARSYVDQGIESGKFYSYTLVATTTGGLSSAPSPVASLQTGTLQTDRGSFTDFKAARNRKEKSVSLQWKHDLKDVKEIVVYKGESGKSVSTWKVLKGFEVEVNDKDVKEGTQYEYIIRATLNDGKVGATAKTKIQY